MMATLQAQIDYMSSVNGTSGRPTGCTDAKLGVDDISALILKELGDEKSVDSRDFARKYNLTANV